MSENILKWDNDNIENWTPTTLDQIRSNWKGRKVFGRNS
jgi:hypothetical protein